MTTSLDPIKTLRVLLPEKLQALLVSDGITVKEAIKKMDEGAEKILFVIRDERVLVSTITDGDIRRWILTDGNLDANVQAIGKKNPITLPVKHDLKMVRDLMLKHKVEVLPVVDNKNHLCDALFWSDVFADHSKRSQLLKAVPVVIMAGGKGTRLDPFTRILPKPLIPLGDKPIVEAIMDRFDQFGCEKFYLTVNYKGKMIQSYFENADCKHHLSLIWESKSLGTAGSLVLLKDAIGEEPFFVSNCDIIVKADYDDIYQFHETTNADITIVGSMQHVTIPYGVLETTQGGELTNLKEKPEYDLLVNTGLYVLNKRVLNYIKHDEVIDFPELIERVRANDGNVFVYPISQRSWLDAGQWQEYQNLMKDMKL